MRIRIFTLLDLAVNSFHGPTRPPQAVSPATMLQVEVVHDGTSERHAKCSSDAVGRALHDGTTEWHATYAGGGGCRALYGGDTF